MSKVKKIIMTQLREERIKLEQQKKEEERKQAYREYLEFERKCNLFKPKKTKLY